MSPDADLFDAAERYQTLPAPAASSPTIPVPRPSALDELDAFQRRCSRMREQVRTEARALMAMIREREGSLSPERYGYLRAHIEHAAETGHLYSLQIAVSEWRAILLRVWP